MGGGVAACKSYARNAVEMARNPGFCTHVGRKRTEPRDLAVVECAMVLWMSNISDLEGGHGTHRRSRRGSVFLSGCYALHRQGVPSLGAYTDSGPRFWTPFGRLLHRWAVRTPRARCTRCGGRLPLLGTYPLGSVHPSVPSPLPREVPREVGTNPRGVGYLGS